MIGASFYTLGEPHVYIILRSMCDRLGCGWCYETEERLVAIRSVLQYTRRILVRTTYGKLSLGNCSPPFNADIVHPPAVSYPPAEDKPTDAAGHGGLIARKRELLLYDM